MKENNEEEISYKRNDYNNSEEDINHDCLFKLYHFFPSLFASIKLYFKNLWKKIHNSENNKEEDNQKKELIHSNIDNDNHNTPELKDNIIYFNNNYNIINVNNYSQEQIQVSKQKLKQLESQTFSNNTMARMICCAELYALSSKIEIEQIYKKFDEFDNFNRKTQKELKGELILQIKCFQISLKSYIKDYNKYDFPYDYDEKKTLEELEHIKNSINLEDKKFYEAIIKLLKEDTNIPTFEEEIEALLEDDEEDNGKVDPKLQLETDIPIMRAVDKTHKELKNNYLKNPLDFKVTLDLDIPKEKNDELKNLVKKLDAKKLEINIKKKEKKISKLKRCKSADELITNNIKIKRVNSFNSLKSLINRKIKDDYLDHNSINNDKISKCLNSPHHSNCNCSDTSSSFEEDEIDNNEEENMTDFEEDMK